MLRIEFNYIEFVNCVKRISMMLLPLLSQLNNGFRFCQYTDFSCLQSFAGKGGEEMAGGGGSPITSFVCYCVISLATCDYMRRFGIREFAAQPPNIVLLGGTPLV